VSRKEVLSPQDYIDADNAKEGVVDNLSLGGAQLTLDEPLHDSMSGQSTTLNILSILTQSGCVDSKVCLHASAKAVKHHCIDSQLHSPIQRKKT
jgi:hypothetical protein